MQLTPGECGVSFFTWRGGNVRSPRLRLAMPLQQRRCRRSRRRRRSVERRHRRRLGGREGGGSYSATQSRIKERLKKAALTRSESFHYVRVWICSGDSHQSRADNHVGCTVFKKRSGSVYLWACQNDKSELSHFSIIEWESNKIAASE